MNSISAKRYTEGTLFASKKEALTFAKSHKFSFRKPSRAESAWVDELEEKFIEKLDKAYRVLLIGKLMAKQSKQARKFILENIQKGDTSAEFKLNKDFLNTPLKYSMLGTKYEFNPNFEVDEVPKDKLAKLIRLFPRVVENSVLMVKIDLSVFEKDDEGVEYRDMTKHYTVNEELIKTLLNMGSHSDNYQILFDDTKIVAVTLYYKSRKGVQRKKLEGGFFKYHLKEEMCSDKLCEVLERYQIYRKGEKSISIGENCLIHSLKLAGVDESLLQALKMKCRNSYIPIKYVRKFAEENDFTIYVKESKHSYKYGSGEKRINLCLIDDHYFIYEKVDISDYSIRNYEKVKGEKKWWRICGTEVKNEATYYRRLGKESNNSFRLVKRLISDSLLEPLTVNEETLNIDNTALIRDCDINLDNRFEKSDYKPIEVKEPEISANFHKEITEQINDNDPLLDYFSWVLEKKDLVKKELKIAFDFETTTEGTHKPYMVSYGVYKPGETKTDLKTIMGEDCPLAFLRRIEREVDKFIKEEGIDFNSKDVTVKKMSNRIFNGYYKITLYAHSITYDIQFLLKHVIAYNPVYRSGDKVCGGSFKFGKYVFRLKDTYAVTDASLKNFQKMFGIKDIKKEIMPYGLYTEVNVRKAVVLVKDALEFLKEEEHDEFKSNIKKLGLMIGKDHFNHMEYARFYCEQDVRVMMTGYFTFRDWVLRDLDIDIDKFLTISSISDEFFKKKGCYDGALNINGVARYFIQKTVVGGRCMSRDNEKYIIDGELNDLDGVSLYPSAMKRIGEVGGYLIGAPKVLEPENKNMDFLNKADGYFVSVRIKQLGKNRHFPLLSKVEGGIRNFTNDVNGDIFYLNKFSLEDAIRFHKIKEEDLEIIDGYYFNEGRNNKILETIQSVFNFKAKYKAEKNPLQNLYKLIMNSAYGKTILKENGTKTSFFDDEEAAFNHVIRNYNTVAEMEKLEECGKYKVKKTIAILDHFNACHIGSEILSMSKRIMNEVICLAEDHDIGVYYQDTDSMHIENKKIGKLSELFKKKYGRELIGLELGTFHCDFAAVFDKNGAEIKAVTAVKTIIAGKKSYMDLVKYEDGVIREHFRLKGVPIESVKSKSVKYGSIENLYAELVRGKRMRFDLLKGKIRFRVRTGVIKTVNKFIRCLRFEGKYNNIKI